QVLTSKGASADPTFQPGIGANDFRLTLTSGTPVTTADVLAAVTLYWTPRGTGNRCTVFDSAGNPTTLTSAEISIAIPAVASQLYSVFAFNNAGVLALELTAWTNDTTPGPAAFVLTTTGAWTKTGDLTRRYLGQMRTTTVAGQTESSFAKRYVVNVSNTVLLPMRVFETTDTWTYSTATWRQANGNAANQLDCCVAAPGVVVRTRVQVGVTNGTAAPGVMAAVSIREDAAGQPVATSLFGPVQAYAAAITQAVAYLVTAPTIGRHTYLWQEYS